MAGPIGTYSAEGIVQDLGTALGLPKDDLNHLSKQLDSHDGARLQEEMLARFRPSRNGVLTVSLRLCSRSAAWP